MKVFVDSNVVVSSFTSNGLSRKVIDLLVLEHTIILSPQVLEESQRIIITKFDVRRSDLDDFIRSLLRIAEVVMPPYFHRPFVRDADDIDILAAAIKGGADVLVTGDKDLLDVPNPSIRILRPRELYDMLTMK